MEQPKPQKEHQWLQKLVGEWTTECECGAGPDGVPIKSTGTDSVRSLGGIWMVCEGRGEMPGGDTGTTIMSLGYDPEKKRFMGTFIGSMMTHMWVYDGILDEVANRLTLDTVGPTFKGDGTMTKYKDIIEFKNDDYRVLTSHSLGDDGEFHQFMTGHYRRVR